MGGLCQICSSGRLAEEKKWFRFMCSVMLHISTPYFLNLQCQNGITLNQSFIFTGPVSTVNQPHSHRLLWSF